jgi:hypothetical protein
MTDPEYDTFTDGIGITTLASDRGTVEGVQEDSPIAINGVALPEGAVLEGGQGVRHFYPPEMAERAADQLQQQLDDDEGTVHIVKNFHELEGQAPADDIIGEVTGVGYEQGVGVRFAGEITDVETAEKIQLGYLDVSPTVGRALADERDAQMEARPVADIAGFRDIAIVGQGQPGADVAVGPNPAIEALARAPVSGGDLVCDVYEVSEPEFSGYETSAWDAPTLEGTYDGDMEAARNAATWVENGGETFDDLSLFVLNGEAELNTNALDSAWRLAAQTDGPTADDVDRLRTMYEDIAEAATEARAISDDEFDDVWQDRVVDAETTESPDAPEPPGATEPDTMSLDKATQTLAEEYDLNPDEVETRLTADADALGGEDGPDAPPEDDESGESGDGESPETPPDEDDGRVLLVEAGDRDD